MAFTINRFLEFFKRSPDQKPVEPPVLKPYQRSYDRYPIEFEVIVTLKDQEGKGSGERCALKDVSGGGAMFISPFPSRYVVGQLLKMDIFLAGTQDVRACIKTEATVVRIHSIEKADERGENYRVGVAVKFHQPFEFERMDHSFLGGFR